MSLSREQRNKIKELLLYEIGKNQFHNHFSISKFAESHNISRQSIHGYIRTLEKEQKIIKGNEQNSYQLIDNNYQFSYIAKNLQEDVVWRNDVAPLMGDFPEIAFRNCSYAFTEMLNNAIDHSEGTEIKVIVRINSFCVSFQIIDNGVGIFNKIANAMDFDEKRFAILELAKGKFTTDPNSHSGEGIFFSAKMSDVFAIFSDDLVFSSINFREIETEHLLDYKHNNATGTTVYFIMFRDHSTTAKELFDRYTQAPDDYGFTKTIVPVRLLEYGEQQPVFASRSQAKRLLARFERFKHIELDFSGVKEIGQGFADEIFRVFKIQHPNSHIEAINVDYEVMKMINHVVIGSK